MATVAPGALYAVYQTIRPYLSSMQVGGIVGDARHSSGYHISREDLLAHGRTSDYSIQCPADRDGSDRDAAGIDITLGGSQMVLVSKRLRAACEHRDPRIEPIREFIGTVDNVHVSGYNRVATGTGSRSTVGWHPSQYSDASHLWHVHVSVLRRYCDDGNRMRGLAEVIAGVPAGRLGWHDPTAPDDVQVILNDQTRHPLYVNQLRFVRSFPRCGVYRTQMLAFKAALNRAYPLPAPTLARNDVWGWGTDVMVRWVQRNRLGDRPDPPGEAYFGPVQLEALCDPRQHIRFARHVRYGGLGSLRAARAWLDTHTAGPPAWMKGLS